MADVRTPEQRASDRKKNRKALYWLLFVGALIAAANMPESCYGGCDYDYSPNKSSSSEPEEVGDDILIIRGKDAVRAMLKDADSAKFRGSFVGRTPQGDRVVCGQVNSKNSLGGYTGFQRFVSRGKGATFLEEQVADFAAVWSRYCAGRK